MDAEVSCAALVGRTDVFKQRLLRDLNSFLPFWPAEALLVGWGMEDTEVKNALLNFVGASLENVSVLGHLLPKIIEKKDECRRLLLEALKSPNCKRHDFVMRGFLELGDTDNDTEVVDAALPIARGEESSYVGGLRSGLITGYFADARVRQFALDMLEQRDAPFPAIASSYGNDPAIRKRLLEIATPLPASMRLIISQHLSEAATDDEFALCVLDQYDLETDQEVKVEASIRYLLAFRLI